MIDFTLVGKKIIALRKLNNMTQDDLAQSMFVSRQLVSKWENASSILTIDSLVDLCKLFNVRIEELLCLEEKVNLTIDEDDIFKNNDRTVIINRIINRKLKIDLIKVFSQFNQNERMIILRNIKENIIECDLKKLYPLLNDNEIRYLEKR